jgi:hypothetical protein
MNPDNVPNPKAIPAVISEVRFYQIKSNFFRVVHADGVWASVNPHGHVHLAFYNERSPLPQEVVHPVLEGNVLGDEILSKRVTKQNWVREMEVDIVMTYERALALHNWLGTYLSSATPQTPPK